MMLAQPAQFSNAMGGHLLLWFSLFWLVTTAFWLWMLVDCLTKKRLPANEKLVWTVVLLFSHVVGAVLYFVLVRSRRPDGNLPPGGL